MSTPFFSIIIPVYNTESTLGRCLDSCVNQSLADIEIIVINNGSAGDTESIVKKYPRVKYVHLPKNIGLFAARRYGVEQAAGEYIIHCDSDDTIDRRFCQRAAEKIQVGADLIISKVRSVYPKYTEDSVWANLNLKDYKKDELFKALIERKYLSKSMWGKVFKKNIALRVYEVLGFDGFLVMAEDCLFFVVYSYFAKEVKSIKDVCYFYYISSDSYNRTPYDAAKAERDLQDFETAIRLLKKFADVYGIPHADLGGIIEDLSTAYFFRLKGIDGHPEAVKKLLPRIVDTFNMQGIASHLYDAQLLARGNVRFLLGRLLEQICPQGSWRYLIVRKFAVFMRKLMG